MSLSDQIERAVAEMGAIPFFPQDAWARVAIMRGIDKFVSGPQELRWLTDTAVEKMRKWEGIGELRGLYCTRFSPKDGREENCTIAGFTASDSESEYLLQESSHKRVELCVARSNRPLSIEGVVAEAPEIAALSEKIAAQPKNEMPIRIEATPVRTPEERELLKRSIELQVAARQEARK